MVKIQNARDRWTNEDRQNDGLRKMEYTARAALTKIGGAELHKNMLRVLPKANDRARGHVVALLGVAGRPEATAVLWPLTNDKDVGEEAIEALGRVGTDQAVEHLLSLIESPKADVRNAAARALGYTRSPKAVEPLIAALKDEDEYVRQSAASALGKIGDRSAAKALLDATGNTPWAFRALADLKDRRVVPLLLARLREHVKARSLFGDTSDNARTIESLAKIGDRRCVPELCRILAQIPSLTELSRDIAWALGEIEDPRAFDTLAVYVVTCRKNEFRAAGSKAIGKLGGKEASVYLSALIAGRPEDIRQADRTARRFKLPPMNQFGLDVKTFLSEKPSLGRAPMAEALGTIGDPVAVPALLAVLNEPDKITRQGRVDYWQVRLKVQAVRALGRIKDERAKIALERAAQSPEVLLRCFAADALRR